MNPEVTAYIERAPQEQQAIMNEIRTLIHLQVPQVIEEFKWSRPIFKTDKDFAYLQANNKHVNLGFYRNIDQLNDSNGWLEGTGKTMRHVKIKSIQDLDIELLKEWFTLLTRV